jgi:alpha-N-acetylgalactosaminidase
MGFVSWQRFRCNVDCRNDPENCISEHLYKSIADALVSEGYREAGYTHVNMDDCWEGFDRDASGRLQPNATRFPSGIPHLAQYMRARGLSLGIYTSIEELSCAQDTPGMISQPGAPHYQTDAETLVSWGVSSLKLDKCGGSHFSGNVSYPHVSRLLLSAAQQANSTPIMLACSWPDYARAWGIDAQYKLAAEHCNLWRVFDDIDDKWESLHNILEFYAGNTSLHDMNVPVSAPASAKGSYWAEHNLNGEGYRTFLVNPRFQHSVQQSIVSSRV